MNLIRHLPFLKVVMLHSLTAFGGPQGHYGMMLRRFVQNRQDLTEQELLEITAFCQMLPGASSTQTLMLIGYKRGGPTLAILTLLLWLLPASIFMCLLSFLFLFTDKRAIDLDFFKFVQPMAVGFLAFATFRAGRISTRTSITLSIAGVAAIFTFLFFKNPIVFPLLIVAGGIVTNFNKKKIPVLDKVPEKIKWGSLILFIGTFLVLGFLSGISRQKQMKQGFEEPQYRIWNLSENFYRFGSMVFGGGDVLVPLMYEQFVIKPRQRKVPEKPYMTSEEFLTGSGMVRAIPGPVFSVSAFHGGMAMKRWGVSWQIAGCFAGLIFMFLPSVLLVFFFYPIWNYLKRYAIVYRSLEGINAVVVGIMTASCFHLLKDISIGDLHIVSIINIGVIVGTFFMLNVGRIPSQVIVLLCLLLGWMV